VAIHRPIALIALSLACAAEANAHAGHDDSAHAAVDVMSCDTPPADAVRSLPAPLADWAVIECSPMGQQLVQASRWQWRYPASFKVRPVIPAWSAAASEQEPGAKYFIELALESVAPEALAERHGWIGAQVSTYRDAEPAPPRAIRRLRAENNLGHEFDVWFAEFDAGRMWAVMCVPECRVEYAFRLQPLSPP
jgi:hypothetical protein